MAPLLSIHNLTCRRDDGEGSAILHELNLDVEEGEVVILKGQSGCGKTTLLKCIAELNVYQGGEILLHGKPAKEYGIPTYRTRVLYVPQRPSLLPGTPLDFLRTIQGFSSRSSSSSTSSSNSNGASANGNGNGNGRYGSRDNALDPFSLAESWGIDKVMWTRTWSTLSGGEGQRIALAIAVGLGGAEIILLDEPTSALDAETMEKVERSLVGLLPPLKTQPRTNKGVERRSVSGGPKAFLWITHEAAQAERVGTRTIDLTRR